MCVCSEDSAAFAKQLHQWGSRTSLLCAALLHHTSRNNDLYEDATKQLFVSVSTSPLSPTTSLFLCCIYTSIE